LEMYLIAPYKISWFFYCYHYLSQNQSWQKIESVWLFYACGCGFSVCNSCSGHLVELMFDQRIVSVVSLKTIQIWCLGAFT
jgi:hypothetical protein